MLFNSRKNERKGVTMSRKTRKRAEKKKKRTVEKLTRKGLILPPKRTVDVHFTINEQESELPEIEIDDDEIDDDEIDDDEEEEIEEEKARGDGQGNGGERQGDGGADTCTCPECGAVTKKEKGVPCSSLICSECDVKLTGTNEKKKETKKFTKQMTNKYVPIVKLNDEKHLVYGVVYGPDEVDSQGEYATAEEIEKACHIFVKDYLEMNVEHRQHANPNLIPVEIFIAPIDFKWGDLTVRKGSWCLVTKVLDERVWKLVKAGELTGYSMEGEAMRAE